MTPGRTGRPGRPLIRTLLTALLSLGAVGHVAAQSGQTNAAGLSRALILGAPRTAQPTTVRSPTYGPVQETSTRSPALATALSAVVPGAGQLHLGQGRGWVYLGLEAVGWIAWANRRAAGNDLRRTYRDFAWTEARIGTGPRVDGDFDYYERLSQWERSGHYDRDPSSPGIQPETDATAYNGTIWARALGIHAPGAGAGPGDPRYDAALAYYSDRAYGEAFLWDWSADPGARSEYADIIRESDARYRQATNVVGAIIANHVVSAVDAFVSSRGGPVLTESRVLPGAAGRGLRLVVSLRRTR